MLPELVSCLVNGARTEATGWVAVWGRERVSGLSTRLVSDESDCVASAKELQSQQESIYLTRTHSAALSKSRLTGTRVVPRPGEQSWSVAL